MKMLPQNQKNSQDEPCQNSQYSQYSHMMAQEWLALQEQHEHYERGSLLIKLVCIVLVTAGLMLTLNLILASVVIAILWLQEGIFRTSQARLAERLLELERSLAPEHEDSDGSQKLPDCQPFQLHTAWRRSRPGVSGLLREYTRNGLRPTVAFPYCTLLALHAMIYLVW